MEAELVVTLSRAQAGEHELPADEVDDGQQAEADQIVFCVLVEGQLVERAVDAADEPERGRLDEGPQHEHEHPVDDRAADRPSNQTAPWAANTMKNSIVIEKNVLQREARAAFLAAAGASGLASPPSATFSALPMTIFWLRQITPHTLRNIVMPKSMPVRIAVPPMPER